MRQYVTIRADGTVYKSVQYEKTREIVRIDYPNCESWSYLNIKDTGIEQFWGPDGQQVVIFIQGWVNQP